jgi:hypothetical protein
MTISEPGRGLVRRLGLAAAAVFALAAASQQRAEALSLASPGTAPSVKYAIDGLTTEVRHGGGHGGGGGFRGGGGGGFRGGGGFHGGGYRAARVFHGGGYRYGYRHVYHRPHFYHRHHFHRRFYAYPGYYYGYRHRYCRVIWTYYGPRKICRYRPWYRHHWRHHYGYPRYW